jgi:serine phosphatase RsbU (regulator of sigma subunit)/tetratricopeptide (TPR) repeat protein
MKKLLIFLFLSINCFGQLNLDSLEKLLPKKKGEEKIRLLCDLCWEFGSSNIKKAEKYGLEAVKLAEKSGNDTLLAQALNDYGTLFLRTSDYNQAKEYYSKVIEIRKKLKDEIGLSSVYSKIAVIEEILGNYSKALEMNLKVLKIYEKQNKDKVAIGTLYGNISVILYNMNYLDRSLEYNNKSFQLGKQLKNYQMIASAYGNYGSIYGKKKDTINSIKNYKLAIENFEKINNLNSIASCYNNLGNLYNNSHQYDTSFVYYEKSLNLRKDLNDRTGILSIASNIASINLKMDKPRVAIKFALEALNEAKNLKVKSSLKELYYTLSIAYSKINDYKNAFEFNRLYIEIKDSLYNEESSKQIAEMSTKYETEKKESQILLLKKDQEVQQIKSKRQNIIIVSVVIGLVFLIFISLFVTNRLIIIRKQKVLIEQQKHLVEEKNREILDSLTYAKRIQSAILPQDKLVKETLQNSFILYKPKDIVAGDFYWMEPMKNGVIFAAADCTGHGVPGAMVSVVCHNALNRSVREYGISDPGSILNKTREIVIQEFEKSDTDVKDGMDISLCYLNINDNSLKWSGANNPLWIIRKGDIIEFKPDKQPIGKYFNSKPFNSHSFQLEKNDSLYIFTDGYQDQFGGPEIHKGGKKFKASQMRELLLRIQDISMEEQRIIIEQTFETWKGNFEQVDDVCVIGVKI